MSSKFTFGSADAREADGCAQAAPRRHGVLLINLGTPRNADLPSVRKYLAEFLADPAVIQLPAYLSWLNRPLGWLIARFRAPKSLEMYRSIWTERGSPLGSITQEQAAGLAAMLPPDWHVFHAMRYGEPSIARTLERIEASGVEDLVVVPMYPQFSGPTTGTAVRELYGCLRRNGHQLNVTTRTTWYDDGGYIHAQAKLIEEYARAHNLTPQNSYLVFSAHGLPISYVDRGDPYPTHIRRTIELVTERLGWPTDRSATAFQSRLGPVKWLEPNVDELLQELARNGEKRLVVCPISFTVDCLETLEEIDVRYRKLVEACGADMFLCPALNAYEPFLGALKELVLRGSRPVTSWGDKVQPLLSADKRSGRIHRDTGALLHIGASLASRIGYGEGPRVACSTEVGLKTAKQTQCAVVPLLRSICDEDLIREGFLWNTCSRFEFYGWLPEGASQVERDRIVAEVRDRLFPTGESDELRVNVLFGTAAWHHLMRTACGFNSGLPGDRDVLEQLQTARRVAERAGTAGRLSDQLVKDAVALEQQVREQTAWGQFDAGYCEAAMVRAVDQTELNLADARCVVLGGSTTSRSVLTALARRFHTPTQRMTLVYRGHGSGQIKLLRKAIGHGKRVRVQSYAEPAVAEIVTDADLLVIGTDAAEPVLRAEQLRGRRDFRERPLTILDFNSFGSTTGMETLEGVTLIDARKLDEEVRAYGQAMSASGAFDRALAEAEGWIVEWASIRQCGKAVEPSPAVCRKCGQPEAGRCAWGTPATTGSQAS